MTFLLNSLVFGVTSGATYALISAGLSFLFGVMGTAFMAHGAVFALGAYAMYYLYAVLALPASVSILLAALAGAAIGVVVEFVMHRRLWHDVDLALVAYIGLLWAMEGGMQVVFGAEPRAVPSFVTGQVELGGGIAVSVQRLLLVPTAAIVVVGIWLILLHTRFGLYVRAVRSNRQASTTLGINTFLVNSSVFAASLALASLAGAITAPLANISPTMGFDPLLKSFIIVILGGMGSFGATVFAAFAFGILESVLVGQFGAGIGLLSLFVGVAAFLVVRPKGIAGI
ncbi:branched-chain amino acid transport system permease protein/urea transport system permease protein [Rhizobiales bacterium GAS113]|nr:branched-chain amino acid transport system permease protein/urea transport system permease protein [Rhizobiales bacterium GAS113]